MSAMTLPGTPALHVPTPRFLGVVRGEIFKITRFRATWIMGGLLLAILSLPWLVLLLLPKQKANALANPLNSFTTNSQGNLSLLRVFLGFSIAILAVMAIGTDYQQGTIRIVLARGVERLQLLAAKTVALLAVAGVAFVALLLWELALGTFVFAIIGSGFGLFNALNGTFWHNTALYVMTVGISTLATLALAISATVLGRSLAFGMAVAFGFFAADNIGTVILSVISRITNSDFWLHVTRFLLGPNLNAMPTVLLPQMTRVVQTERGTITQVVTAFSFGPTPVIADDFTHTLLVTLAWTLGFAIIATVLTWRRDVLE